MEPPTAEQKELDVRLRAWRRSVATELKQPAFCIFSDRVLRAIVVEQPDSEADLLGIHGLGKAKVERWGADILKSLHNSDAPTGSHAQDTSSCAVDTQVMRQAGGVPGIVSRSTHASDAAFASASMPVTDIDRALKVWRMHEAKRQGVAPFVFLLDQTIRGIIAAAPRSQETLRDVEGLSPRWVEQHGNAVIGIVAPFLSSISA